MTHQNKDLDDAIQAVRTDVPTADEIRTASARVMQRLDAAAANEQPVIIAGCEDVQALLPMLGAGKLTSERALVVKAHLRDCMACRSLAEGHGQKVRWDPAPSIQPVRGWNRLAFGAAAAVLVVCAFLIHNMYFAVPAGARGTVQSVDGSAYLVTGAEVKAASAGMQFFEGDLLRTAAGGHAFVKLADGSVVEVRERSELSVKSRGKDSSIGLGRGAVLVQAAKRTSGHLYVNTPDCRVAVTGTVFAVDSGLKGSRVSVVEGTVDVKHGGAEDVLHAGDQVSTGDNMSPIPVEQDIAWSQDLPKHLELLAQFSKLQRRLEQVNMPAPRFNSSLLGRMPADAIFFASLPNAGQALEDANRIMQEQIQQSPALRDWWTHGDPNSEAKTNDVIAKLRGLSDYLGDEIVIVGMGGQKGGVAVVASLRRSDIEDYLNTKFASVAGDSKVQTITEKELTGIPEKNKGLIALVRQNEVVFGTDRATLEKVNAQLNAGSDGLGVTAFGLQLQNAYNRGAGFLLGADLQRIIAQDRRKQVRTGKRNDGFARSGLAEMRYLILEHREVNGLPENRMALDFAGERKGVASWLAAPGPMGSLEFISRNASVAVAFLTKDPQFMMDDVLAMSSGSRDKTQADLAEVESKLNVKLREDIAAHFGGDGAFALDGPVLPTPSWKLIVEVHDAPGLAASLTKLVEGVSQEAERKGKPGVEMKSENVSGQAYYTVQSRATGSKPMYFTFAAGYMIIGPDRAVLMNTLRTRVTGDSLARSGEFKALLPRDEGANYSAIAYQNLSPILQPLMAQFSGAEAQALQQLAADSRPSVICVRGRQSQIEAVTNSRLLGFDWITLANLLKGGTSHKRMP